MSTSNDSEYRGVLAQEEIDELLAALGSSSDNDEGRSRRLSQEECNVIIDAVWKKLKEKERETSGKTVVSPWVFNKWDDHESELRTLHINWIMGSPTTLQVKSIAYDQSCLFVEYSDGSIPPGAYIPMIHIANFYITGGHDGNQRLGRD